MLKGKKQKVDWCKYKTWNFRVPYAEGIRTAECGAWALHILTGKPYEKIAKLSKDGHWSNKTMFSYLKRLGYEIHPVTLGNMVDCTDTGPKPRITYEHVLLIDQRAVAYENTWSVIYRHMEYHSGELAFLDSLNFINYPIQAAYVIWHKKWK